MGRERFHVHSEILTDLVRTGVEWLGRTWTVAPVVLVREMVLADSDDEPGVFLPYEEIERTAEMSAWEARPVSIFHPETPDGSWMSAGVLEASEVRGGELHNVVADPVERALVGEVWLDEDWIPRIPRGAETLAAVQNGDPLEDSTGYWAINEPAEGTFEGREYFAIQRGVVPDHLALLPGARGKCSIRDGCGVNRFAVNEALRGRIRSRELWPNASTDDEPPDDGGMVDDDRSSEGGARNERNVVVRWLEGVVRRAFGSGPAENELSFSDIEETLRSAIHEAERLSDEVFVWIRATFDDRVIYGIGNGDELFARTYTIDEGEDEVSLGEAVEVEQRTEFVEVGSDSNDEGEEDMERNEMVTYLAERECVPFDREALSAMSDEQVEHLYENAQEEGGGEADGGTGDGSAAGDAAAPASNAQPGEGVTLEDVRRVMREELGRNPGLAHVNGALASRREELMEEIVANRRNQIPRETLDGWDDDVLRQYAGSIRERSFAGAAGARPATNREPPVSYNDARNRRVEGGVVRRKKRSEIEAEADS